MRFTKVLSISIIFCVFFICLAGCSNTPESVISETNKLEEPINSKMQYSEPLTSSVEGPLGAYSLEPNMSLDDEGIFVFDSENAEKYYSLLYFTDKETNTKIVLCNAPNCQHADESCNAYFYSMSSIKEENENTIFPILDSDGYVYWYNDKLYVIDPFGDIIEMKKDGTNHKKLLSIDSKYNVLSGYLYNENIYLNVQYLPPYDGSSESEFSDKDYTISMLEINPNSGKCTELFSFANELDTTFLGIYENKAYFFYRSPNTLAKAPNQKAVDDEENGHDVSLYYYELHGTERKYIKKDIKSYEMDNAAFDRNAVYYHNRKEKKLLKLDLDTQKTEEIITDIGGYIEINTPTENEKLFFMKNNMLADAFSGEEQENEDYYVDLNTKEVIKVENN